MQAATCFRSRSWRAAVSCSLSSRPIACSAACAALSLAEGSSAPFLKLPQDNLRCGHVRAVVQRAVRPPLSDRRRDHRSGAGRRRDTTKLHHRGNRVQGGVKFAGDLEDFEPASRRSPAAPMPPPGKARAAAAARRSGVSGPIALSRSSVMTRSHHRSGRRRSGHQRSRPGAPLRQTRRACRHRKRPLGKHLLRISKGERRTQFANCERAGAANVACGRLEGR
jgi:hypothetical protein